MSRRFIYSFCLFLSLALVSFTAPEKLAFDKYHTPDEVASVLKSWSSAYPQLTKLITAGKSSGNSDIFVLRIAAQGRSIPDPDKRPAVFISANIEGAHLVGTEAALMLIEKLLTKYGTDKMVTSLLEKRTVYVAPLLNPDVAQNFFAQTRYERLTNNARMDDDLDDLLDEDGPEDLNKDGFITLMRVKDPEGKWISDPTEPRLMRAADAKKGEKGIYEIYSEGLDNDGDGKYNEDPPGGVELNRNFPHDFEFYVNAAGRWPISQKETIALIEFLVSHPNIAMVLNFSTENTFLNLQQTGRAAAAGARVRVPRNFASFLGLDPEKEYDIQELVALLKGMNIFGGREIDESMVAMMLGLGPAMTIDRQDQPYMEAVQKDYKDGLKKAKIDYPEKRAKGVGKGSFVAYCYYQYGVQVFSSDLWTIPEPQKAPPAKDALTVDKLKTMTSEEFLALGEEKIDAFLKEQGAPPNFKASMLMEMVKSGRVTPERMVEMMQRMPRGQAGQAAGSAAEGEHPDAYIVKWSDTALNGKGFVDWKPFKHPTLGDVEIGGFVPYLKLTPPPSEIEKTIAFYSDFYIDLMNRLPQLEIKETKVKALENGLYQVTVYFTNTGWFPTSTAQGRRAGTSWPIRVRVQTTKDQTIFSGRVTETIPFIDGSGDTKKLEWTVKGKKGSKVTITASSPKLDSVTRAIVLE
jgi:hypothetical protein